MRHRGDRMRERLARAARPRRPAAQVADASPAQLAAAEVLAEEMDLLCLGQPSPAAYWRVMSGVKS